MRGNSRTEPTTTAGTFHRCSPIWTASTHIAPRQVLPPPGIDSGGVVPRRGLEGTPGEDERRSEQLASASLKPLVTAGLLTEHELQMVSLLVRATATHKLPKSADLPAGYEPADIELFLDADMAILAADSARYRRYLRGVRSEYSHFDDEAFRTGRTTFLRSILGRERIFLSEQALQLWEEPAQANLRAELSEWEQEPQRLLQALIS